MKITDKKKCSIVHNFVNKDIVIGNELKIIMRAFVVFRNQIDQRYPRVRKQNQVEIMQLKKKESPGIVIITGYDSSGIINHNSY